ncbi:MAG: preprotein translocase subunit YajC [Candidatus Cloacimonadales bacterium]
MNNIITSLMMAGKPVADGAQPAGGGLMQMAIMFVPLFLIFYFLIIRPQKKQQKEQQNMLDSLKKDDYVQLSSGILGKIVKINEEVGTMSVEVDKKNQTVVEVVKSAVVGKVNEKGEK